MHRRLSPPLACHVMEPEHAHNLMWSFKPADRENDRLVVRTGDRVYLEMMGWGGEGNTVPRGYLGRHTPSRGDGESFTWKYSLGTEHHTSALDITPMIFTIEITAPPHPANADASDEDRA